MMISKVRLLGLGLFPAEKDVDGEEKPPDEIDFHSDGLHELESGPKRSARPAQAFESDHVRKVNSNKSAPITESAGRQLPSKRSSGKAYGLQLFEDAVREHAQKREREHAESERRLIESEPEAEINARSTPTSTQFGPERGEQDSKHSRNRNYRQGSSYDASLNEINSKFDVQTRLGNNRNDSGCRASSEEVLEHQQDYVEEDAEELCCENGERTFTDEDHIQLVQKRVSFRSLPRAVNGDSFLVIIPKRIMKLMPKPPNSYVSSPSVHNFYIRVVMVHMSVPSSVDAAVNWLMGDGEGDTQCILGLKCELGTARELKLIQLSLHRRCVLIRLLEQSSAAPHRSSSDSSTVFYSPRLAKLLDTHEVVKTGTEIEDDALAIYWATSLIVNSIKNVTEVYMKRERAVPMLSIFRKLYKWEWRRRPEISKSDWGLSELSPNQIKYGIMNAWSSRMVALKGAAAVEGAVTLMSLENLPRQILDLFGRAIADALKTEDSSLHETSGTLSETADPGVLQLTQHSFRSRVKTRCDIELHLKNDQGSAAYKVKSRKGKAVILTPMQRTAKSSKHASSQVNIESIKSLTILEAAKRQGNWKSKPLWDGLKKILRDPKACPRHLLLALGCNVGKTKCPIPTGSGSGGMLFDLGREPFTTISHHLNDSQREAWHNILTTPLSATIGPPGTGKTSLIQSVAKSWIAARRDEKENSKEVLICTAYQNVAVRHLAETLVDGEVPGVLLLISEDYYSGWHEGYYTQLSECLVVSSADQCELSLSLAAWRTRNDGREYPNVVVCTVDLIGCPSFTTSLMKGKVTALIIDESSQASDCSFLRPVINLSDLAMVSVLGDPHQLPPYSAAQSNDVVPSVFDLVSKSCKVIFLREQYRMPPSICEFLSAEIYDNVLMTAPLRLKEKNRQPLVWSHVKGTATTAAGKTSLHNVPEAKAIVRFCKSLVNTMEVDCERVVVLTLYEEQTRRISDGLAADELTKKIPVHNVDSFQGQQCDIVVISLVAGRSFSPFAADERRACVMLSRVRRLLCVFGDFDVVKRNDKAGLWMKLANHCDKQNLVVDEGKLECFLAPTLKEANDTWVPRQDKTAHVELLSHAAVAAEEMPPGIAVQVIFKAR